MQIRMNFMKILYMFFINIKCGKLWSYSAYSFRCINNIRAFHRLFWGLDQKDIPNGHTRAKLCINKFARLQNYVSREHIWSNYADMIIDFVRTTRLYSENIREIDFPNIIIRLRT